MRGNHTAKRSLRQRPVLAVAVAAAACALVGVGAVLTTTGGRAAPVVAKTPTIPPLRVVSFTPGGGSTNVAPDATLSVVLSAPLTQADVLLPSVTPPVPGSWSLTSPTTLTFTPSASLPPGQQVTVDLPGGHNGVAAADGAHLAQTASTSFTVAPMSLLRVQQLLAQLDYLPLTFTPQNAAPVPPTQMALVQPGSFAWRWSTFPAILTSQWTPGQYSAITKGAVMAFEDANNLTVDGIPGPQVWAALLRAAGQNATDPYGHYDWVDVSTTLPETATVWRDGQPIYQTPVNTGVPGAATALGTYPVYLRYRVTTMRGTNPNGTTYDDPGIPWVSYFNGGDALHGFVRAQYGFPQSDGCVEMPPANAAVVWPLTPIGTLVTVQ
jgi:hypothetical protein